MSVVVSRFVPFRSVRYYLTPNVVVRRSSSVFAVVLGDRPISILSKDDRPCGDESDADGSSGWRDVAMVLCGGFIDRAHSLVC
jgi:hypothetical protein